MIIVNIVNYWFSINGKKFWFASYDEAVKTLTHYALAENMTIMGVKNYIQTYIKQIPIEVCLDD